MVIGVDGNEANVSQRVGVNKYALEVINGIYKLNEVSKKHKLIVYLKKKPLKDLPCESPNFKYKVLEDKRFWILTKLMPYLWRNPEKIEVLLSPSHYTPPILTIPRVISIMDLGYLESSDQFKKLTFWQLKYWTAISVFASKQILTISESSKEDIVRHYPLALPKITVTHLGYDSDKFNLEVPPNLVRLVKKKYHIVSDYILFVSTLKPSKNLAGLIDAFLQVAKHYSQITLVIAGKKGWMYEDLVLRVKKYRLTDRIIFTDYISEQERPALMAGAKLYVLPSFWEGFGIEILSAFGCGKPVVVSDVGSIPEVAGNAGIYVDPKSPKSIARGVEKILKMNKSDYNKQVKQGLLQARKFSWEKCAEKTLQVLESTNV